MLDSRWLIDGAGLGVGSAFIIFATLLVWRLNAAEKTGGGYDQANQLTVFLISASFGAGVLMLAWTILALTH